VDYAEHARWVLQCEIDGLEKVKSSLGDAFVQAVESILRTLAGRGKIVVTGVGKNLLIGQKISATLASTGATSVVLDPTQAMHGDLGILDKGDVLLALSYSGESDELLSLVPQVKRLGIDIVALTGNTESSLASHSNVVVPVTVGKEACPFNMAPTTSTTAALAVGDALAMVLLKARGLEKDDYAKLHPAGSIGRALLLRVSDFMRTGKRLASVQSGASVQEALVAMTQARSGSTGVVDASGTLQGIFTDGDLRRHLPTRVNILEAPIEEVMTPSPCSVRSDQLAVDVLKIFEEHSFDDLLVVDADGRLVGAVDIQDLPKMKIM